MLAYTRAPKTRRCRIQGGRSENIGNSCNNSYLTAPTSDKPRQFLPRNIRYCARLSRLRSQFRKYCRLDAQTSHDTETDKIKITHSFGDRPLPSKTMGAHRNNTFRWLCARQRMKYYLQTQTNLPSENVVFEQWVSTVEESVCLVDN